MDSIGSLLHLPALTVHRTSLVRGHRQAPAEMDRPGYQQAATAHGPVGKRQMETGDGYGSRPMYEFVYHNRIALHVAYPEMAGRYSYGSITGPAASASPTG